MGNVIATLAIVIVIGLAVTKIVKEKKKGVRCIGCPSGGCSSCCSGCSEDCDKNIENN